MAPRALFVALAVAVLLAGCRQPDDEPVSTGTDTGEEPAEQAPDPTTTTATTGTTAPTGTRPDPEADGPVSVPAGAPTADELAGVLPGLDELPTAVAERFELEPREREDPADPLCEAGWPGNLVSDLRDEIDVGGAGAFYGPPEEDRSPNPPPSYLVSLAPLPDAAGLVADARAQLEACAAAGPGPETAGTWEVLDWPSLGDGSVVGRMTSSLALYEGGPVPDGRRTTVIASAGDVVVLVELLVFGAAGPAADVPDADLQDLAATVVERVATLR